MAGHDIRLFVAYIEQRRPWVFMFTAHGPGRIPASRPIDMSCAMTDQITKIRKTSCPFLSFAAPGSNEQI